jgi:hypothetical protein
MVTPTDLGSEIGYRVKGEVATLKCTSIQMRRAT